MRQTAVEFLVKEFSEILGKIKTQPMEDLLLVDAINKANEMFYRQITNAYESGVFDGFNNQPLDYYNETYREEEKDIEF